VGENLDWRLETGEEPWMHGARLRWTRYRPPTDDWDHDHCALCWAKFMDREDVDAVREGYLFRPAPDPAILPEEERTKFHHGHRIVRAPTDDEWICATCFADFAGHFGWIGEKA
jgi:hypothetical protein